jgi:hypothetical protein
MLTSSEQALHDRALSAGRIYQKAERFAKLSARSQKILCAQKKRPLEGNLSQLSKSMRSSGVIRGAADTSTLKAKDAIQIVISKSIIFGRSAKAAAMSRKISRPFVHSITIWFISWRYH